jgi:hypothetical protein
MLVSRTGNGNVQRNDKRQTRTTGHNIGIPPCFVQAAASTVAAEP